MINPPPRPSFHDIVSQARLIEAHSGYTVDPHSDKWELKAYWLDFTTFENFVTENFKVEIKDWFAGLVSSRQMADGSIKNCYYALRACCAHGAKRSGDFVSELSDDIIEEWRHDEPVKAHLSSLKIFVKNCRKLNRKAFPGVSDAQLKRLKREFDYPDVVLTLDPDQGPWLQSEVTAQDVAIEKAWVSGQWHPEKYILVQLLRKFGMRIQSLAYMKVQDVKHPFLGDSVAEIRFPFLKNNMKVEQAMWHKLSDGLVSAFQDFFELRLAGMPRDIWHDASLLTVRGLPGAFPDPPNPMRKAQAVKAGPYQGHPSAGTLSKRFTSAMKSLNLTTKRTGKEKPMHFTPHRERHTVGTRLAMKGLSAAHIAAFLGHAHESSCNAYVDLAVMCFQLREPRFFHLLDDIGAIYTNPTLTKDEIIKSHDIVISKEATSNTGSLVVVGGGTCTGCDFSGASSDFEPWPCLSCPRFHVYEDADLQPLWDIIQERKIALQNADGTWNSRFDPDILATFMRYETLLIGAEIHRQNQREQHLENL